MAKVVRVKSEHETVTKERSESRETRLAGGSRLVRGNRDMNEAKLQIYTVFK